MQKPSCARKCSCRKNTQVHLSNMVPNMFLLSISLYFRSQRKNTREVSPIAISRGGVTVKSTCTKNSLPSSWIREPVIQRSTAGDEIDETRYLWPITSGGSSSFVQNLWIPQNTSLLSNSLGPSNDAPLK